MSSKACQSSRLRPGSEVLELSCERCGTRLVPGFRGWRCPRLSACGYGGRVERVGHVSLRALPAP